MLRESDRIKTVEAAWDEKKSRIAQGIAPGLTKGNFIDRWKSPAMALSSTPISP